MYRFECTLCGDCCSGHQEVRLNPEDLELISSFLKVTVEDLYAQGLVEDKPENSIPRPWIRFKTWPLRFCPFLTNDLQDDGKLLGLCQLHPHHKPLVCALSPLGRVLTLPEGTQEWLVVPPVEGCPGMDRGPERSMEEGINKLRDRLDREAQWLKTLTLCPGSPPETGSNV